MFRFVEPVVRQLVADGHRVVVSFALTGGADADGVVEAAGASLVPFAAAPSAPLDLHRNLASYVTLRKCWAPLLRERWLEYFPSKVVRLVRLLDRIGLSPALDSRLLASVLVRTARLWRVPPALEQQLKQLEPDVVVASPLIFPGSRELDAIRAAERAGIATAGIVLSWDNLTSKGMFHALPQRLLVWNDAQAAEAAAWHDIPGDRVDVLGAPVFDYVFARRGVRARAEVLRDLGIDGPYVVYGGSSRIGLGPGGEIELVRGLAAAVREQDWSSPGPPTIVVRPHPNNPAGWDALDTEGVIVRPGTQFPGSPAAQDDLVQLIEHSDAVIGINTSLFIDAAILGVPLVAPALEGDRVPNRLTHFGHLVRAGILDRPADMREAARLLVALRLEGDTRAAAREAFVGSFIRPLGLDRPAAASTSERLASLG
jgi:hypothetical protein